MRKTKSVSRVSLSLLVLLALVLSLAGTANAAGTGDIDLDAKGSITVTLSADEALGEQGTVNDGTLALYHVADLTLPDWNMVYELTDAFSGFSGELDINRATLAEELAAYVDNAPGAVPSVTAAIDGTGTATFEGLDLGLYLVTQAEPSTGFYAIDPFIVTIPIGEGNAWVYDVDASPKTEVNPNPTKAVDTDGDGVYDNDGAGVAVGDVLSYEISYTNGYSASTDVTITDVLDPGLTYVSSSPRATVSTNEDGNTVLTWEISNVAAYSAGSVTFTARVNEDALVEGEIENTADVQVGENSSSSNKVENSLLVPLEICKTVSDPSGKVADSAAYSFRITLTDDGSPVTGPVSVAYSDGTSGIVVFDSSGTAVITLGAGESATLYVPWNADASITELTTGADSVTVHLDGERIVYIEDNETQAGAHIGTVADSTQVEFVNSYRAYYGIDEEIVTNTNDIFDYDSWIKDESVNEYNAIEIEMSTMLPIITVEDLVNGSITMDFHNVLDAEIILDEVDADFSVYLTRSDGTHVQVSHEYYTVTIDPDDGCSFHVDVDLTRMYMDGVIDESDLTGETMITIFFFADLEGTNLNGSYKSTVWYDIYDGDEWLFTSNVDVMYVFTFDIMVTKYDAETSEVLYGAEFGIYYDPDCGDPVSRNGAPYTEICDEDGVADFYGLGGNTYYIKELVAPEGYELSDEIVEIEVGLGYDPGIDGKINPSELRYEIWFADYPVGAPTPTPAPTQETENTPEPAIPPEKSVDTVGNGMYNNDGDEVSVGSELTYRISFYNHEDDPVTVVVKDTLDEGLDFVSASDGGVYDEDSRTITWTLEDVGSHDSGSVTFVAAVNESAGAENGVENTASVQIGDNPSEETNRVENPVPAEPEETPGPGETPGSEETPEPGTSPEPEPVPEATPTPSPTPTPEPEAVNPGSPDDTTPTGGTTTSTSSSTSETLPQTGMIFWPIILLASIGGALVLTGFALRRRYRKA